MSSTNATSNATIEMTLEQLKGTHDVAFNTLSSLICKVKAYFFTVKKQKHDQTVKHLRQQAKTAEHMRDASRKVFQKVLNDCDDLFTAFQAKHIGLMEIYVQKTFTPDVSIRILADHCGDHTFHGANDSLARKLAKKAEAQRKKEETLRKKAEAQRKKEESQRKKALKAAEALQKKEAKSKVLRIGKKDNEVAMVDKLFKAHDAKRIDGPFGCVLAEQAGKKYELFMLVDQVDPISKEKKPCTVFQLMKNHRGIMELDVGYMESPTHKCDRVENVQYTRELFIEVIKALHKGGLRMMECI